MCPASRQGKSTVTNILHKPLKIMVLHFLFRELCGFHFETDFFSFTLTDIFLQCPHDSSRVA